MPNTKKGGYKPSKFTKFMKSVNIGDLIEINFLWLNNAKVGNQGNVSNNYNPSSYLKKKKIIIIN